jgi:carbonic anhydrase/acetyltransferase-like protein (isoleucine patch superfamily)
MIKPYKGVLPRIAKTAFIEDSAQIIGDVVIGEDSSVWFNVVVRGDVNYIRIGNRTNIQDGTIIHVTHTTHPTVLEDDVTVGHAATIHGCTIRSRVLIGMGATILDGAEIGPDTVIGAGALVTEGKKIPSGWLALGSPAKPVRELTAEERQKLLQSSANYVNYKKNYSEG